MNLLLVNFDCFDVSWIRSLNNELGHGRAKSVLFSATMNSDFPGSMEDRELCVEAIPNFSGVGRGHLAKHRLRTFEMVLSALGLSIFARRCATYLSRYSPEVLVLPELFDFWQQSYRGFLLRCLKKHNPEFVLLGVGNADAAICAHVCREQGVSFAYLLSPYFEFKDTEPILLADSQARVLVTSRFGSERLRRQGVRAERILLYRSPDCDHILSSRQGLPSSGKEILLLLQNKPQDELLLGYGMQFLLEHPEVCLRVRLHPGMNDDMRRVIALKKESSVARGRVRVSDGSSLDEDIQNAQVVFGLSSNAFLAAVRWIRPIVMWSNSYLPPEVPFAEKGHAISVSTASELFFVFRRVLFTSGFMEAWKCEHDEDYLDYFSPTAARLHEQILHLREDETREMADSRYMSCGIS